MNVPWFKSIFLFKRMPFKSNNFKQLKTSEIEVIEQLRIVMLYNTHLIRTACNCQIFVIIIILKEGRAEDYSMTDPFMPNCVAKQHDNLNPSKSGRPHSWISIRTSFQWRSRIGITIEISPIWVVVSYEADRPWRRNILAGGRTYTQFCHFHSRRHDKEHQLKETGLMES